MKIGLILVVLLLLAGFCFTSYKIGQRSVILPEIKADTVLLYDTVWQTFTNNQAYYLKPDTIKLIDTIPSVVDTAAILKDYYLTVIYNKQFKDSNIIINDSLTVSRNRVTSNRISYKWMKPTQIVNNVTNYNTYYNSTISLGLDLPLKDPKYYEFEAFLNTKRVYFGVGFMPEIQSFNIKFGSIIKKLRGRGASK
jgi:hypothetical protein